MYLLWVAEDPIKSIADLVSRTKVVEITVLTASLGATRKGANKTSLLKCHPLAHLSVRAAAISLAGKIVHGRLQSNSCNSCRFVLYYLTHPGHH